MCDTGRGASPSRLAIWLTAETLMSKSLAMSRIDRFGQRPATATMRDCASGVWLLK
jgi:hypothetical protein